MSTGTRYGLRIVVILVMAVLIWIGRDKLGPGDGGDATDSNPRSGGITTTDAPRSGGATGAVERAFADRASEVMVEASGRIKKMLPDDNEGSRHQRLIVELSSGHTVLISHNIDLAPRVPADEGDTIRFYGQYEWSDQGGVVHWTHHDPKKWREGGWIEHAGRRYE